jgi:N-acyl homoserine lactone hydrolase
MAKIALYIFQTGIIECKRHNITLNEGFNDPFNSPVPWFLLTHPKGNVVIDGGNAVECATDPVGHWGEAAATYRPIMKATDGCLNALRAIGVSPESVKFIVQSHLHMDHTGAAGRFSDAIHVVQRAEYEYAFTPDWFSAGAYVRKDFDKPNLKWFFLQGKQTDFYDFFGDGVIRLIFTPGHSPGHQSLLIYLPETGPILLTVDAVYTMEHWEKNVLPGFMTNAIDTVRSVAKLRFIAQQTGAKVIPGHDPDFFRSLKKAPECYE